MRLRTSVTENTTDSPEMQPLALGEFAGGVVEASFVRRDGPNG